jgi:hypothetical protein
VPPEACWAAVLRCGLFDRATACHAVGPFQICFVDLRMRTGASVNQSSEHCQNLTRVELLVEEYSMSSINHSHELYACLDLIQVRQQSSTCVSGHLVNKRYQVMRAIYWASHAIGCTFDLQHSQDLHKSIMYYSLMSITHIRIWPLVDALCIYKIHYLPGDSYHQLRSNGGVGSHYGPDPDLSDWH